MFLNYVDGLLHTANGYLWLFTWNTWSDLYVTIRSLFSLDMIQDIYCLLWNTIQKSIGVSKQLTLTPWPCHGLTTLINSLTPTIRQLIKDAQEWVQEIFRDEIWILQFCCFLCPFLIINTKLHFCRKLGFWNKTCLSFPVVSLQLEENNSIYVPCRLTHPQCFFIIIQFHNNPHRNYTIFNQLLILLCN